MLCWGGLRCVKSQTLYMKCSRYPNYFVIWEKPLPIQQTPSPLTIIISSEAQGYILKNGNQLDPFASALTCTLLLLLLPPGNGADKLDMAVFITHV